VVAGPHRRPRRPRRRVAADLLDLVAIGLLVPLLGAALGTSVTGAAAVATASWAAAAAPAGAGPTGGPLTLTWSASGQAAVALADVVATGTLALTGATLRLEASTPRDAGAAVVVACLDGTWVGADCSSGRAVTLGTLVDPTPVEVALPPGGRLALRATAPRSAINRTTFTLRVEVPRTAARPGGVRSA
jgi:hypothetical protein